MKCMIAGEKKIPSLSDEEGKFFLFCFAESGLLDLGQAFVEKSQGFLEIFWYCGTLSNDFQSLYIRYQTAFSVALQCNIANIFYKERARKRSKYGIMVIKCGISVYTFTEVKRAACSRVGLQTVKKKKKKKFLKKRWQYCCEIQSRGQAGQAGRAEQRWGGFGGDRWIGVNPQMSLKLRLKVKRGEKMRACMGRSHCNRKFRF